MQNVRVERREAPAGEFATVFVGDVPAWCGLNAEGDDDAVIAAWQAGGILLQEPCGDYTNPPTIDLALWSSVGATRIVFGVDNDEDSAEYGGTLMLVVSANYSG